LIDLHAHTTESDGTLSPAELVDAAAGAGLEALAITDHDTFTGFDTAAQLTGNGVRLLCGIEISTAWGQPKEQTVHLLGYFFDAPPTAEFREWLDRIQAARCDRNIRLAARLRELGLDVRVEEAQALGRSMTGRPHFARVLVNKGYCTDIEDAFDRYLDESAPGYVQRDEPMFEEAVQRVVRAGGIASLAHPVRLDKTGHAEAQTIEKMVAMGLPAIEVWHSDHGPADERRYMGYAQKHGLLVTGGSDFHGENKPRIELGRGAGNLRIPRTVLEALLERPNPARR
jgi:predicted metal-dependent phosphoesterase TrpH